MVMMIMIVMMIVVGVEKLVLNSVSAQYATLLPLLVQGASFHLLRPSGASDEEDHDKDKKSCNLVIKCR